MNARTAIEWLNGIAPELARIKAEEQAEAAARLRIYKAIPSTAETFDRALALLDLCKGQVDSELADEIDALMGRVR